MFRALADPTRRHLLDALYERDGRTLTELAEGLAMSRQAVTKHLAVLEEAGLVTAVRRGRERHHHLNPAPLADVGGRWIPPVPPGAGGRPHRPETRPWNTPCPRPRRPTRRRPPSSTSATSARAPRSCGGGADDAHVRPPLLRRRRARVRLDGGRAGALEHGRRGRARLGPARARGRPAAPARLHLAQLPARDAGDVRLVGREAGRAAGRAGLAGDVRDRAGGRALRSRPPGREADRDPLRLRARRDARRDRGGWPASCRT